MARIAIADDGSEGRRVALICRGGAGLVLGLGLALLHDSHNLPLYLVTALCPLLLMLGCRTVPLGRLLLWLAVAAAGLAGLGLHAGARGAFSEFPETTPLFGEPLRLWFGATIGLLLAHVLVTDGLREGRWLASYTLHFDTASKLAIQLGLAVAFTGAMWGMLALGAESFAMLGITTAWDLFSSRWFAYPASALAVALAIHVSDTQPALVRGVRVLALTLLSWLLPPLALILAAFLASLPFVSLEPLWATRFAATLLLVSAASLIFLVNGCHQDGALPLPLWKRAAVTLASLELVPLVALATWALQLRVAQYGWTVDRILAAAVIVIMGAVALGYAMAALAGGAGGRVLETTNRAAAFGAIAVVLALFTPLADPARLMVADQMARLQTGQATVQDFDFAALKFDGARWGAAALESLARTGTGPASIRTAAAAALEQRARAPGLPSTAGEMSKRVVVLPAGRALPEGFIAAEFGARFDSAARCLRYAGPPCLAVFLALRPGAAESLLWVNGSYGYLYEADAAGNWVRAASVSGGTCPDPGSPAGDPVVEPHAWPDIVVGARRLTLGPLPDRC